MFRKLNEYLGRPPRLPPGRRTAAPESGSIPEPIPHSASARPAPGRRFGQKLRNLGLSSWGPARRYAMAVPVATVMLTACATVPPVDSPDITRAESAIAEAQRAGADDLASDTLNAARRGLVEARAAALTDPLRASQYAEQARANARLASLTSQREKATGAAAEVDESVRTLEREANRESSEYVPNPESLEK